ncbi:condensation domain-containing protein [Dactylosporangium sp. NPDC050588]|uniref:condensation domain-containing protein n=1 Tax=Dactylosporangium sp. NPDC050588 TaxID=3157211 RepID=UPI0033E19917
MTEISAGESGGVERAPLSLQLDFLRLMDGGGGWGPFGPRFTVVAGWRVEGEIDLDTLHGAMHDVVARHETLRTRLVLDPDDPHQEIHPPSAPRLVISDLDPSAEDRDAVAEAFINAIEEDDELGIDEIPGLRVYLGRFDAKDSVLAYMAHHTAVDGYSVHLVMRDLAAFYAARKEGRPVDLPPARQYREFVAHQLEHADDAQSRAARAFWREELAGARMTPLANDRPRATGAYTTGWHRYMFSDELDTAVQEFARTSRSSPFMVLMAAFLTVLRERTGETDLVVPTFMPGRGPAWTADVIGTFYNFTPLRVDLSGCETFTDAVAAVRRSCLAAYRHELPFLQLAGEAPELMASVVTPRAAPVVFQVIQSPFMRGEDQVADLRFAAIRRRTISSAAGSQIPDGMLVSAELHPAGGIGGRVGYTDMFDESTVVDIMTRLREVLRTEVERG